MQYNSRLGPNLSKIGSVQANAPSFQQQGEFEHQHSHQHQQSQQHIQPIQPPAPRSDPKYRAFVPAQGGGDWQGNMYVQKPSESAGNESWQYSRDGNLMAPSQYEPN